MYTAGFCVFVVKAVHIEMVSVLTSESLIRFVFRIGNATTFVRARREIRGLFEMFRDNLLVKGIENFCGMQGIK